jgi:hypothetical protein
MPRKVEELLLLVVVGCGCGRLWGVVGGALHGDAWRWSQAVKQYLEDLQSKPTYEQEPHPIFGYYHFHIILVWKQYVELWDHTTTFIKTYETFSGRWALVYNRVSIARELVLSSPVHILPVQV